MTNKAKGKPRTNNKSSLFAGWPWVVLCLVILFVVIVRVRLLNLPLERDEGEFAYIGQLMLDGVPPYKLAYAVKLPGTAAAYALSMMLFGQTPAGIHLGLLLANVTAIVLVFFVAKKWFNETVGVIAAGVYGLMSLSWGVYGHAAHATQFVIPAALAGILLMDRAVKSGRLWTIFGSGLFFGAAFLLKQPGLLFGLFGGLILLGNELRVRPIRWGSCLKKAGVFGAGVILPFFALCIWLGCAGTFDRFWYWSFRVAGEGWASPQKGWDNLKFYATWTQWSGQLALWVQAGIFFPFIWWLPAVRPVRWQFLGFCVTSICAGAIGFNFYPHYIVLMLPAVGMIVGAGVVEVSRRLRDSPVPAASLMPVVLLGLVCGWTLFAARQFYFTGSIDEIEKNIYSSNPFREAAQVAEYIRHNSSPDDRIAVLGSEPEIYFLAHRKSATGHVSTYILMENRSYSQAMQEEMAREIENARPEYIVYVDSTLSWLPREGADHTLVDEMNRYIAGHYRQVGMTVNGRGQENPIYYWDADAVNPPRPEPGSTCIDVYRRQDR